MKSLTTIGLVVAALLAQSAFAQTVQFRVPIALQWGAKKDTLYVGVNSGNGGSVQANTYELDLVTTGNFGPLGLFGEVGSPPPDAEGNRVRFIDVPGHTQIGAQGGFFKYDFRGYTNGAQADTFVIEVTGAVVETNDLTVSWGANLSQFASAWSINSRTLSAIGGVLKNMLEAPNQYIFAASGNPQRFAIVKTGANPVAAVKPIDGALPAAFTLEQNFPNPFNPSTEIRFTLPQSGMVTLGVYNLLGQKVAEVVHELKAAGAYSVRFDAAHLASGTYLYRLQTNGLTAVRKLTVLK
jgi:hypothetical protein